MTLQEKVRVYKQYQRDIERLTEEMESVKDEIKAEMTRQGVDDLTAGEYRIRWTPYKTTKFDEAAFRSACPDLYKTFAAAYSKTVETRRFSVV